MKTTVLKKHHYWFVAGGALVLVLLAFFMLSGGVSEAIAAKEDPYHYLIIEAHGVIDIDFTGSEMLQNLITELRGRGVDVALARMSSERALAAARRTGLIAALGEDHIFRSVEEAVRNRPT